MDETFLKLLQEMADMPDVPCSSTKPEDLLNASSAAASQKAEQLENYVTNASFETDNIMPAYLKSQIMMRAAQPDILRATDRPTPKSPISKRLELFFYSCKVAGAVAAAFAIMIASVTTTQWIRESDGIPRDSSFSFSISDTRQRRDTRDTKSDRTRAKENTIRITESLGKSSSAFTGWLQSISDFLVNSGDNRFDT